MIRRYVTVLLLPILLVTFVYGTSHTIAQPAFALSCGNPVCLGPNSSSCDGQGNLCWLYEYGPTCGIVGTGSRCCKPDPACGGQRSTSPSPSATSTPPKIQSPAPSVASSPSPNKPGGGSKKAYIVYVSAKFQDMNKFHTTVEKYKATLLSIEPFKSRASNFEFHSIDNNSDLHCKREPSAPRVVTCDQELVTTVVNNAKVPYDSIVVIIDEDVYGGAALLGSGIAFVANDGSGDIVSVHELGHAFGKLHDEYSYGKDGSIDNKTHANCYAGNPPADEWKALVADSEYNRSCTNENWYRPSQTSLMKELSARYFNKVSLDILNKRIDALTK